MAPECVEMCGRQCADSPTPTRRACAQHAVIATAGAWSIEGTGLQYDCTHANELRVANYSLFALFGLAAINEAVLTVMGLRGGWRVAAQFVLLAWQGKVCPRWLVAACFLHGADLLACLVLCGSRGAI